MFEETRFGKDGKGKKGSLWPWLIGGALAFGGWCLYDKKKKAQALTRAREAQLQAQTQPAREKTKPGGNHPGLKIRGQEGFSAENRLRAILDQEE